MHKNNEDLQGKALQDYYSGNKKAELIVHSDITGDDVIPVKHFFRGFSQLPHIEKVALDICQGRVLDVGAGAGAHARILQKKGFDVLPIDLSPGAVGVMKSLGLSNARQSDFFEMAPEKFDTILMLMNGIGICGTLDRLDIFLEKAKHMLKPGGQILMDSSDIIYMFEEEDGTIAIDLNRGYYGEVIYRFSYGERTGAPFPWLFLDFDLLESYAAKHGFDCEKLCDGEHFDYLARLRVT